jgi:hypothetical protein
MVRTVAVAVAVAVTVTVALAAPAGSAAAPCPTKPRQGVVEKSSKAVVFVRKRRGATLRKPYLYGCDRRSGAARGLGWYGEQGSTSSTLIGREAFELAGRFVAFLEVQPFDFKGVDVGERVVVVDLVARATAFRSSGFQERFGVDGFVARADGAVAWISGEQGESLVRAHSGDGDAVLDTAGGGMLTGLALSGSTLTWRHAGALRSARL